MSTDKDDMTIAYSLMIPQKKIFIRTHKNALNFVATIFLDTYSSVSYSDPFSWIVKKY